MKKNHKTYLVSQEFGPGIFGPVGFWFDQTQSGSGIRVGDHLC